MMALHCNGQQYAREAEGVRYLWEYIAWGWCVCLNLDRVADAVWEGEEI